jgi:hypothetical protein
MKSKRSRFWRTYWKASATTKSASPALSAWFSRASSIACAETSTFVTAAAPPAAA